MQHFYAILRTGLSLLLLLCLPGLVMAQKGKASHPQISAEALAAETRLEGKDRSALLTDKTVLAPGNPPLTQSMVVKFQDFLEWTFQAILTRGQRAAIRQAILEAWRNKDKESIASVQSVLEAVDQVAALEPAQRKEIRLPFQTELVNTFEKQKEDETIRWLLDIYYAAHNPIAPGPPPLTRQVSDAQCEMMVFMLAEAAEQSITVDEGMKAAWAKQLATVYQKMSAEERQALLEVPKQWATLRFAWAQATEKERAEVRASWTKALQERAPLSRAQQTAFRALKEVAPLLQSKTSLTAAQRKRGHTVLTEAIAALKSEGGAQNQENAQEVSRLLPYFADPPPASPQRQPPDEDVLARAERKLAAYAESNAIHNRMMGSLMATTYSSMNLGASVSNLPTGMRTP